ncbi:MAG: UDP-3-O-acyl-N-acetylglucosamine deacetylase [Holosporaceae bacterium]|jgi:UDP-3-O-[3-hydroxymyristoyl] N-acetylglucosamine deacetylase|nr:UDP-3-O-acyl-N-acetylglucosamine deacetylase [Holosporaceae bacterium]
MRQLWHGDQMFQATLGAPFFVEGCGVHSGNPCSVSAFPASEDHGLIFVRQDLGENNIIEASYKNIYEIAMCTKLSNAHGLAVSTVEHLLAAFAGFGIANAILKVSGEEIPILDGSAAPFAHSILSTGIKKQPSKRKVLKVLKYLQVEDDFRWVSLSPDDNFSVHISCDFKKNGLETRPASFDFSKDDFAKEIAPARTFGFLADVEFLRKNNLARGATLENTVVFDEKGLPLNADKLRFPDEPMRHKILDIIGDLSLSGYQILGKFEGFCPSHKMNHQILETLFENPNNFAIVP